MHLERVRIVKAHKLSWKVYTNQTMLVADLIYDCLLDTDSPPRILFSRTYFLRSYQGCLDEDQYIQRLRHGIIPGKIRFTDQKVTIHNQVCFPEAGTFKKY